MRRGPVVLPRKRKRVRTQAEINSSYANRRAKTQAAQKRAAAKRAAGYRVPASRKKPTR